MVEIVTKTWRVNSKVQVEKLDENVFKFVFGSKKDRISSLKGACGH